MEALTPLLSIPGEATLGAIYRLLHLLGMAYVVGGATMVAVNARSMTGERLVATATRYEQFFWPVIAVQVLTGIGSAGLFGAGLPGPETAWGALFTLKLALVVVVLLLSMGRLAFVAQLGSAAHRLNARGHRAVTVGYWATAAAFASIVLVAVRMAHG